MTTPRIDEIERTIQNFSFWNVIDTDDQCELRTAFTEAYQAGQKESNEDIRLLAEEIERLREDVEIARKAGIDEAVETIKEWVQENKDLTTIFGSNQAHWYIEAEALDDTIKALQNNK